MITKNFKPYLAAAGDTIVDVSNSFTKLIEYKKEELIGQNVFHMLNNMLKISISAVMMGDIQNDQTYFIFTKQNKYREVNIIQYKDADLNFLVFNEIPNSRIEDRFPYLYQQIKDDFYGFALFAVDNLILLKANDKYINIINKHFGHVDIVGKKISDFIDDWNVNPVKDAWTQAIKTGNTYKVYEYKYINYLTGQEEYVDRSITPLKLDGMTKYLVIMLNDETERVLYRKQNEEQRKLIEQQNEQLETIIDQMSDALFIIDKDGNYIMDNKAAKEYFYDRKNGARESYNAATYYELDGSVVPYEKMPIYQMMQGETLTDRILLLKSSRMEAYVSISATPIFDRENNYVMGILSSRDVTDNIRRNATIREQQRLLLEAEKKEKENLEKILNMKDEFLSLVSHEFKTPLTVINSALQTMELICRNELTPKAHMFLDKIRQNTYRQLRLVNNLLDITRANAGHVKLVPKNIDIVFITRSIVESVKVYAQQKGVNLSFISDLKHKVIALDEEKYERIILNLLSNSIKFTPENKKIIVKISQKKDMLRIEVKDQGVGIPIEKQEIIFERFGQVDSSFTRQAEGTGIGLYLVKLLVEAFGGHISLKSEVDKGSTFSIVLPITVSDEQIEAEDKNELIDSRFVQAIAIEFSDIYF